MESEEVDIETFKRWSIPVLQNFLRVRNLSSTGKKKSELVALAYSASIMNIPPVKTTEEEQKELVPDCKKRARAIGQYGSVSHVPDLGTL